MENADWSSISQWWIPATNNNNLCSLAQRELWDRMEGTRRGTGCPSRAGRKERGSIWVWVWVSTTLLSFIIACQMHILPYIVELIVGSPAPLYAQQPFRQPFTRTHRQTHGNVLADRQAAGRHLHMLMARGLRCAWWVTFRTFYDFGFLMVTALVGAVLQCLSTVQCRFRSIAIDFYFKINCFRLSVDSCSTTCGSPMLRPAPDPVPIPFPALC